MVSTVLFETSTIVPSLAVAVEAAQRHGAEVLLDAYHAFCAVPFQVSHYGADPIFVTGGGYKYAQWGEGCCWLRVPSGTALRPVYTGWFSDFEHLAQAREGGRVTYGPRPADRFAGSTYDPASHYRARAVIELFDAVLETSVAELRALSLRQTQRILDGLDGFVVRTPSSDASRGGFVAIELAGAGDVVRALRERGIHTDARGDILRLGPAPYVTDDEIDAALEALRAIRSEARP